MTTHTTSSKDLGEADIVVRYNPRTTLYVADGPDGHSWLLARTTEAAARRDGLVYFLNTRTFNAISGRWELPQ